MKFNELSIDAQNRAVDDYQNDWLITHPNDPLAINDIYKSLSIDCLDDFEYEIDGEFLTGEDD